MTVPSDQVDDYSLTLVDGTFTIAGLANGGVGALGDTITDGGVTSQSGNQGFLGDVGSIAGQGPNGGDLFMPTDLGITQYYVGAAYDPSNVLIGVVGVNSDGQYTLFRTSGNLVGGGFFIAPSSSPLNAAQLPTGLTITVVPPTLPGGDSSGANIFNMQTEQVGPLCFMPATRIATPSGEAAVESLQAGELVLTSDGCAMPIRWVGRQSVSTLFADPTRIMPIRIKAGALGDAVPSRDLLVSPDHAILVDGVLVHASALVNGISIVRETAVPRVFTYYHIELTDHSLLLAENVPAETFIDNVHRAAFDNWQEHEALYPAGYAMTEMAFPRAKSARQVPLATRERLAARCDRFSVSPEFVAA